MPCSCHDCQGPQGGWTALQLPLLTLGPCSPQPCNAPGPRCAGCHLTFWRGRSVGWQGRQEQAACVRSAASSPVLCEPPLFSQEQGSKAWGHGK